MLYSGGFCGFPDTTDTGDNIYPRLDKSAGQELTTPVPACLRGWYSGRAPLPMAD